MVSKSGLGSRIEGAGLELVWRMDDIPPLPWLHPPQALQVLRIVQEALSNVVKHAHARQLVVATTTSPSASGEVRVAISITDNGDGFDMSRASTGRGLRHIKERTKMLGGEVSIESSPGNGTRLCIGLPGPTVQDEGVMETGQA